MRERDCAVIRIRYKDFSAGTHEATWLHGRTQDGARGITVYLVPGLTSRQRRAVIRRLRQEASRGFGPPLPLPQLVVALGVDRVRTVARVAGSVVRLHPTAALLPSGLVAALMALFVITSAGGTGIAPGADGGLAPAASAQNGGSGGAGPFPVRVAVATVAAARASAARDGAGRDSVGPAARVPALGPASAPDPCPDLVAVAGGLAGYGQLPQSCSSAGAVR
jgi:hypothetical protein